MLKALLALRKIFQPDVSNLPGPQRLCILFLVKEPLLFKELPRLCLPLNTHFPRDVERPVAQYHPLSFHDFHKYLVNTRQHSPGDFVDLVAEMSGSKTS